MSLGGYFEGLGVALGESSAQFLPKTPGSIFFERFLRQNGSQKTPKWSQYAEKVSLKFDQKINAVLDRIFIGFWLICGAKFDGELIKNQHPQAYQRK